MAQTNEISVSEYKTLSNARLICSNHDESYKYIRKWMACVIQKLRWLGLVGQKKQKVKLIPQLPITKGPYLP